jgi:6,7-dimethyl-8-ribityllumazine synthase
MSSQAKNLSDTDIFGASPIPSRKVAVVFASWNPEVTYALRDGALSGLSQFGILPEDLMLIEVPGTFELPLAAQMAIKAGAHGVICIGCVVRGETPHFDYICQGVTQGIMHVGLTEGKPVIFGVLTVNSQEQALDRAGGKHGNKGTEAAVTLIKMLQNADQLLA